MYYLGVDGGGTKTASVLFDTDTGKVRTLTLEGGNICVLGKSGCRRLLDDLIALLLADIAPSQVACSTFGFAGAGRETERSMMESLVSESGFAGSTVITDAQLLHYSFFAGKTGIMVASGTGSVCLVNTPDGQYHQIGGWGYILGDEGSGFHIGKLAIRHALGNIDNNLPQTVLTGKLLEFFNADNPKQLVTKTYSSESPQRFVASCAQLVDELAKTGDKDALNIIDCACGMLIEMSKSATRFLVKSDKIRIALAGSVLSDGSKVNQKYKQLMTQGGRPAEYMLQRYSPASAAVLYCADRCGYLMSQQQKQTLENVTF